MLLLAICCLILYQPTVTDLAHYRVVSDSSAENNDEESEDIATGTENDTLITTALVMRTVAPIRPPILQKIYRLASELQRTGYSSYDFWIMVDETRSNTSEELLRNFFDKYGGKVLMPDIFAVSEKVLLDHYPKLTSYIYNKPEPNFNNETGVCCGLSIMWQMFIPNFALFMNETGYNFGWTFEDDIDVYGEFSLLELIRAWDKRLNHTVDLAAIMLHGDWWGRPRHTMAMERIIQQMTNASVPWKMYSDTVQRHSLSLAKDVVAEVANNVMQFGERLIHPIAWKHNRTIVDLDEISQNISIFGIDNMTGRGKLSSNLGIEGLLNTSSSPATFIFHEELPTRS